MQNGTIFEKSQNIFLKESCKTCQELSRPKGIKIWKG